MDNHATLILSLSSLCVVGRGGMAYDGIVGVQDGANFNEGAISLG
jgi:hypothetical protein